MNNDNTYDKVVREKLSQAVYPYDPQSWAAMEQRLGTTTPKRPIAGWWWIGAVLALLMIGAGMGYWYAIQSLQPDRTLAQSRNTITTSTIARHPIATPSTLEMIGSENQQPTTSIVTTPIISGGISGSKVRTSNRNQPNSPTVPTYIFIPKSEVAPTIDMSLNTLVEQATYLKNASFLSLLATTELIPNGNEHPFYMLAADVGSDAPKNSVSLQHKNLLHYRIGIDATLMEGLAGHTASGTPSYHIGLMEELLIGKRIGLTLGQGYAETHFSINNPKHPNESVYPAQYSSTLREIAIPIGVNVYPYIGSKISVHIGVAYINHIKLSETFAYTLIDAPSSSRSGSAVDDPKYAAIYPSKITLDASPDKSNTLSAEPSNSNGYAESYYSLGNARRYYGSVQLAVGIDTRLSPHWMLTTEPLLNINLPAIGLQNTRLYQIGINMGARYRF